MQFVVLAGGRGARMGELTKSRPKPMLQINGRPIIHRILDHAIAHGFREFVLGLGYLADDVRSYFEAVDNVTVANPDLQSSSQAQDSKAVLVHCQNTGQGATKVERLLALKPLLTKGTFVLSYCDALSDIDLNAMLRFHRAHAGMATIAAVHGRDRFGILNIDGSRVGGLDEKQIDQSRWINGGVFILEPEVFSFLDDSQTDWETGALQELIAQKQAFAYRHDGWWECADWPGDVPMMERTLALHSQIQKKRAATS